MNQEFLSDFQQTILSAEQHLLTLSEEQSETPRAPGKWSPKEIIGHLIDSAVNNHQRFIRAQFENNLQLSGYEQEEWVRIQRYQSEEWKFLVTLWEQYNTHLLHVIVRISDEALQHSLTIDGTTVTLDFVVTDYLRHMKHHINQIVTQ
jgi:hypothetical protein